MTATVHDQRSDGRTALTNAKRSHLRQTLELLLMITEREIKIRYKQSLMGFLWAIFMPTLVVVAGLVVRSAVSNLSGTPLAGDAVAAMVVKALPWAFFIAAIRLATNSLTSNSNLVTRARCPRIVFPLAAVLASAFDLAIAVLPAIVVLSMVGVPTTLQFLWVAPLLLVLVTLVTGLGVVLATANLFFRDVKYIVEVVLMFAIFFTPVLFEADAVGKWRDWIMLNPVAPLLEGLYAAVVRGRMPDLLWIAYSAILSAAICAVAWLLFRRFEPSFADNV